MVTTFPPIKTKLVYSSVATYTDLPVASEMVGEIHIVSASTGTWVLGTQKKSGLYKSDGVNWNYVGNSIDIKDDVVANDSVWSSSKINSMAGGSYIRTDAVPVTLGGAVVGTTFNGTVVDALDKLLYPYMNPAFSSFYLDGVTMERELGATLEGGNITFRWVITNSTNVKPGTVNCNGASGLSNSGSSVQMIPSETKVAVSSVTYTISATNTNNVVFSRTATAQWTLKRYAGVSASATLDDTMILDLTGEFASSRPKTVTYNCTGGRYFYYVYPSSFGAIGATKVSNLAWNDWVLVQRDVVNPYGVSIPMNIYRSSNLLNGDSIPVVWG